MERTLDLRALELLEANTQTAEIDGRRLRFSVPSVRAYPFQWFWDSCFHAVVWSRSDVSRAREELDALLVWQEPSGLIPHVVFWDRAKVSTLSWHYLESAGRARWLPVTGKPSATAGIQPPVLAQAVERIVGAGADGGYLEEVLPALERYYRHLSLARDPDGDGLISIVSQFEGGLDFSPAYDSVVRARPSPPSLVLRTRGSQVVNKVLGFDVERIARRASHHQEDVLVNTVYADALSALGRLATLAGRDELARWASTEAARTLDALLERCYDEARGLFFNIAGPAERRGTVKTIHSLMPLLLPDLPTEVAGRLVEHLTDRREFWAPYPVPSVALDEPTFTRDHRLWGFRFIWRGPLSMNTNWFIVTGLRRHGFHDVADEIVARSLELVARHGFNEFYDPIEGRPVGAHDFGWATLATDLE